MKDNCLISGPVDYVQGLRSTLLPTTKVSQLIAVAAVAGAGSLFAVTGVTNAAVIAGDTYSVAVVGFNGTTSTAAGAYLTTPSVFDPTFGGTTMYPGDALGGQTLTITSSEVIGATTTTDTITLSVPTNFAPTGTTIGSNYIAAIDLDIGGYNAVPADTLDLSAPPGGTPTGTGYINYSGGTYALGPQVTLVGTASLEGAEGVSSGTGATQANSVEPLDVNVISFTFSYPNPAPVPEPASASLLGISSVGLLMRRRRRRALPTI